MSENNVNITQSTKNTTIINRHPISKLSLLLWVLISVVGWFLIPFITNYLVVPLLEVIFRQHQRNYTFEAAVFGILMGILTGVTFGILQWLILRKYIARAFWWIVATTVGLGLGLFLGFLLLTRLYSGPTWVGGPIVSQLYLLLASIVAGTAVGLLQRLVLKRHFDATWLWMLSSVLTWPVYLLYHQESVGIAIMVGEAIYTVYWGLVFGALSGLALLHISKVWRKDIY